VFISSADARTLLLPCTVYACIADIQHRVPDERGRRWQRIHNVTTWGAANPENPYGCKVCFLPKPKRRKRRGGR
jgi:hypothetical protein